MAALISVMKDTLFPFITGTFSQVITTITGNPILFLPVLAALCGSVIFFVIKLVRKLGVRGMGGGRRRRAR